jgi:hypothetical protein
MFLLTWYKDKEEIKEKNKHIDMEILTLEIQNKTEQHARTLGPLS